MWCLARLRCRNTLKFHGPSRKFIIRKVIGKLVCCSVAENVKNEEKLFKVGEGFSISSRAFLQPVLLAVDCWLLYGLQADWSAQRNKLRLSWAAASEQEGSFCCATQLSSNNRALSHTLLRRICCARKHDRTWSQQESKNCFLRTRARRVWRPYYSAPRTCSYGPH